MGENAFVSLEIEVCEFTRSTAIELTSLLNVLLFLNYLASKQNFLYVGDRCDVDVISSPNTPHDVIDFLVSRPVCLLVR